MSRVAIVLLREEIKDILPTMFFEIMQKYNEHYGIDTPFLEEGNRFTTGFWETLNDYFEERFLEVLSGDVEKENENEKLKEFIDHLLEEELITPEAVEGIKLLTRNGLLIIEMVK